MCDYDYASLQKAGASIPVAAVKLSVEAAFLMCQLYDP
jgi:hypothetical protein